MTGWRSGTLPNPTQPLAGHDRPAVLHSAIQRRFHAWLKRRGPLAPPLVLRYRQIFVMPTAFGWSLGLLMGAMLLGSLNFNNSLGLLTTFIVASLALLSMLMAYRNQAGIGVSGVRAQAVFAGQPLKVQVALYDTEGRVRTGIRLKAAGQQDTVHIAPGQSTVASLHLPAVHRGLFRFGRMRVANRVPLGLFETWSWILPHETVLVYPRPAAKPPPLPQRGGAGQRTDRRREGEEFHSLRPWRAGDPLHRIAWKASQRHRELLSRQYQAEAQDEVCLRLADTPGNDLEERLSVLTAWVLAAHAQGMRYALELPGVRLAPAADAQHYRRCLEALALFR